ncbi:hypothetical protein OG689_41885 [Kitasatospora sp. NBC_00240]|uniref:hypothetical protein n=1 Tax=Kitasatospora sp. NBC_00240 TaxID=2903567 RepID=UPI00224E08C0|nr:hypothetical protein [Kitasatospora sp. NBC_00240]MCX5215710.1 hypothetical protein [Kitasatospora sp. NBC_00240]
MDTSEIRAERANFLGAKRALVDAITREARSGTSAKEIARQAAPAFGRDQVLQYVAAVALHDVARKALLEAGLDSAVDISVTGMDTPREARLRLYVDPGETADYAQLPERIRAALRDFQITLAPARDGSDPAAEPDDLLRDGEAARLIPLKPRR